MKRPSIVKLKEWQLPDPDQVRGILVWTANLDYRPLQNSPEFEPNKIELTMVIGKRKELERITGRDLGVYDIIPDVDATRNISYMYAEAMKLRQSFLLGCTERIAFITDDESIYIRGFNSKYGEVLDAYMASGAIWREFRKIGGLEWTEPDANAPSFVPPISEYKEHNFTSLAARGLKITVLGAYEFPTEDVHGILIYGESNLNAEQGLEDRNLCLAVGEPSELEECLGTKPKPRLMVADPNAVSKICRLYSETLGLWAQETASLKRTPHKRMYGTAWTIAFITDRAIYIRGFGARPRQQCIYDEWIESKELYQEFRKIGYLK